MPRATLSATGIVLARDATAGGYERLSLLAAEGGLLHLMRRPTGSLKNGAQPDLFDLCAVELDGRSGGAWFVREYVLTRRFGGLGTHYKALEAAALWARLALANASNVESTESLYGITLKALDAWDRGAEPSAVLLKALYLFARDEGLPAREEWLRELPEGQRNIAALALRSPLEELAGADVAAADVSTLTQDITRWMCERHHIVAPQAT